MPRDVLIVEDDPIIALDFEDTILRFGAKTVRTAASPRRALELIAAQPPDFALLDLALVNGETPFAIAERLDALRIAYVFVTGYGSDVSLPSPLAGMPRLSKPCPADALLAALRRWRCKPTVDAGE
ncbi:response regulator [Bradyrhizobium semiaridum]|uniref:response regulator n=1 Tax=Bradyrhizobium semiaridum TaxID=2821404 RepID=UPI00289D39B7|nr:response regulator [Bradyrhizobium semiaridum]